MNNFMLLILGCLVHISSADEVLSRIRNRGYPAESHFVNTKDGYILHLYRIPCRNCLKEPPQNRTRKHTPVIFLMHGMGSAAPSFLIPNEFSAGYYFSRAGYDVWLGNARGNTYSRNHTTLDPENPKFWQFSWHEIGVFDLPAMIDYILAYTNQLQLIYVGHSQGATSIFVLLSEHPEYNKKIAMVHAMTPPIFLRGNHPAFPRLTVKDVKTVEIWAEKANQYELISYRSTAHALIQSCWIPIVRNFCMNLLFQIAGPGYDQFYDGMLEDLPNYMPAGASYKQLLHYLQISLNGKFEKFDHGEVRNMKLYGTLKPPEYNLSNIKTKMHLMYGTNDWLVPKQNIPLLASKLQPSIVAVSEFKGFNHIDFTYAKDIDMVQNNIMEAIRKFL